MSCFGPDGFIEEGVPKSDLVSGFGFCNKGSVMVTYVVFTATVLNSTRDKT